MKYKVYREYWYRQADAEGGDGTKVRDVGVPIEAEGMQIDDGFLVFRCGNRIVATFSSWEYAVEDPCCEGECECEDVEAVVHKVVVEIANGLRGSLLSPEAKCEHPETLTYRGHGRWTYEPKCECES